MKKASFFLIVLVFLIFGCRTTGDWYKEGATKEQIQTDKEECGKWAFDEAYNVEDLGPASNLEVKLIEECMHSKGYK